MGVDDAAALAWLLVSAEPSVEVIGVSTVFGNTSVENAASNVFALLDCLGHSDVPIAVGAAVPRARPQSHLGALLHGDDGLWGFAPRNNFTPRDRNVARFYRDVLRSHPDAILLTLGPLTNLAAVSAADPGVLHGFSQIVVLGGAKVGGSITPVAEMNFWQDPESAAEVLAQALPVELIVRDAHAEFVLTDEEVHALCAADSPAARFLAGPLSRYATVMSTMAEGQLGLPDVVAAVYAAVPSVGLDVRPACVKVVTEGDSLTRGQSIIGLTATEKIPMYDDLDNLEAAVTRAAMDAGFDLGAYLTTIAALGKDNANVVMRVAADRIASMFMHAITARKWRTG